MAVMALATFDLDAPRQGDYDRAYKVLTDLGFTSALAIDPKSEVDPTTMMLLSAPGFDPLSTKERLLEAIKRGFHAQGLAGEVFVFVGKEVAFGGAKVPRLGSPVPLLYPR